MRRSLCCILQDFYYVLFWFSHFVARASASDYCTRSASVSQRRNLGGKKHIVLIIIVVLKTDMLERVEPCLIGLHLLKLLSQVGYDEIHLQLAMYKGTLI